MANGQCAYWQLRVSQHVDISNAVFLGDSRVEHMYKYFSQLAHVITHHFLAEEPLALTMHIMALRLLHQLLHPDQDSHHQLHASYIHILPTAQH
jgi:hypothetical protein